MRLHLSWLDRIRPHSMGRWLRRPSPTALAALGVFAVAFALRLLWVRFVESPFDNVYSDMGGYVERARSAASGVADPFPIFDTLYPPGAHLVYAAEMKLVGWTHHAPLLLLNCLWGAVVAPCTMLLALRIVPRLSVAVAVGLFMAAWYPLLAFSGFFSSEQPYAGAIALSAWLLVRQIDTGRGAVALGLSSSVAYLVRPQIILTLAALTLVGLVLLWRRPPRAPRLRVGKLVIAGTILTATVAYGAVRYHALCGRWGLISDNSAMTRLWADTHYGQIRARWHAPDGRIAEFYFGSPPKLETGEDRELTFDGYIGDPAILDRARRNEVFYTPTSERITRWLRNVRLLFVDNQLWPDSVHAGGIPWRREWSFVSARAVLVLCALGLLGFFGWVRRPTTVLVVCAAHVVTALGVAAFFFAEARYRVPYDMFFVLLALAGLRELAGRVRRWRRRDRPDPSSAQGCASPASG